MKNRSLHTRLLFAVRGVKIAYQNESSFRTQIYFALGVFLFLLVFQPKPVWWAISILATVSVLSLEMINTALELIIDRLHPEINPLIEKAKDCSAGAVLLVSLASLGIALALFLEIYLNR